MRIESYDIRMDSAGMRNSNSTRKLQIRMEGGYEADNAKMDSFADTYSSLGNNQNEESDLIDDSQNAENDYNNKVWKFDDLWSVQNRRLENLNSKPTEIRDLQSVRQQFVLYLWRLLFGDDSAKKLSEKYGIEDKNLSGQNNNAVQNYEIPGNMVMQPIKITGITESYMQETQSVSFSSQGSVKTADGRNIDFNIDVTMSSRFEQYYREEGLPVVSMCDPLVLNFTGDVAGLSDQKFMFDLDCDGEEEEISTLETGNGFLALDKNNDGVINDGSELFGTKSGDGFADLAEYDHDGNGWIDENDDIFDSLKIWCKDKSGEDKLLNLKEAGVGAIYLGNAVTDYNLRSDNNGQLNGAIRKMGMFLYENATVGTMVHLDIAN